MQSNDRKGKWQPFDALEGYGTAIRNVEYAKNKIAKPILFPDELEMLNEKLANAYERQKEVIIKYYKNGYLEDIGGVVSKIDLVYKEILIKLNDSVKKLKLNVIISIEEFN